MLVHPRAEARSEQSKSPPRVLFVDDDPSMRQSFARAAGTLGYQVDVAASGTEAIAQARQTTYGIVASDLCMPILDGLEVIASVREVQPHATCILVTGVRELLLPEDSDGARALDAVVRKPWDLEQLAEVLSHAAALHAERCRPPSDAPEAQYPISVLMVEDNPADAGLAREMLNASAPERYSITCAACLRSALDAVQRRKFDVILTDLSLPDARGIDVIRHMLTETQTPVLVLSGYRDEALAVQAVRCGAQDYLLKGDVTGELLGRSIHYAIERKRSMQQLEALAYSDPLTGLPNRTLFFDRLERATATARRRATRIAVVFVDLDRFKNVNDDLGHDAGDRVLKSAAERLVGCVRECDTVARVGGDEFAVLLGDCGDDADLQGVTDRILAAMQAPIPVGGRDVVVGVSLGVATFPEHADDFEALLRAADFAMYQSKRNGRARASIASRAMR